MNAYTTMGQARIQPRDVSALLRANGLAGASLTRLEWQRGCQAEAEAEWRLKHNGVTPQTSAPRAAMLRQTIGAAMIRAGERLAGAPRTSVAPETSPVTAMLGTASRPA
jgi:hypothetical protein